MITLRHKIWLGFGGLLLILIAVAITSLLVLTRYSRALDRVFEENYKSAVYCDAMKASLDELNNQAQRLAWGQNNPDRQAQVAAARRRFDADLALQLGNLTLPGELEQTRRLEDLWLQYKQRFGEFERDPSAHRDAYPNDLLPRYQELKTVAQAVADMNMNNMVSVDGQVKRTLLNVRNSLAILVAAGTLVAAIFVGAVGAALLKPLTLLTRSAREIAQGNLDFSVSIRSRDEIGVLAEAFNSMARELRQARRLDQNKIARTEQTTQLAIDSLPDAVVLLGPDGHVEMSNPSARKHFAILASATSNQAVPDWLTTLHNRVRADRRPIEPDGYESAIQLFVDGNERFFLPRAVPIFDDNQNIIGTTAILADVTRLRHSDEARSDLVSTVSHELRTPLTSLRMSILLLAEDRFGPLTAQQAKLVGAATEESDRLYRIIENLLNLSRMESGRVPLQLREMSPADIVAQAVEPLRGAFAQKGLKLEVQVAPDAPPLMADPSQLGYALANVLGNALKFTPAPGSVTVIVQRSDKHLVINVEDTGPGIAPEYSQRVFDKFFRVPGQATGGVGLGLAIARRIIESHHGTIEYHLRSTGGSRFKMQFGE